MHFTPTFLHIRAIRIQTKLSGHFSPLTGLNRKALLMIEAMRRDSRIFLSTKRRAKEDRLVLNAIAQRPSSNLRIESSAVLERTYGKGDIK